MALPYRLSTLGLIGRLAVLVAAMPSVVADIVVKYARAFAEAEPTERLKKIVATGCQLKAQSPAHFVSVPLVPLATCRGFVVLLKSLDQSERQAVAA